MNQITEVGCVHGDHILRNPKLSKAADRIYRASYGLPINQKPNLNCFSLKILALALSAVFSSSAFASSCPTNSSFTQTFGQSCDEYIANSGTGYTVNNAGTMNAVSSGTGYAIDVLSGASVTSINNTGALQSNGNSGSIYNQGFIGTITNSGTMDGYGGITSQAGGRIDTINNELAGSISNIAANNAPTSGVYTISTINNHGSINATGNGYPGISVDDAGLIGTINNYGSITGDGDPTTAVSGISVAVAVSPFTSGASINSLNNFSSGVITGGFHSDVIAIGGNIFAPTTGSVNTITNLGAINADSGYFGINNQGTLTALSNAQGGNSSTHATTALTYTGNLPTNYNIIINSATHYGQLAVTSGVGNTTFGVSALSGGASIVSVTPYANVLTGITASQLGITGANATITSNGYTVYLWEPVGGVPDWNLRVDSYIGPPSVAGVYDAAKAQANGPAYGAAQVIDANGNLSNLFSGLNGDQATSNAASQTLPLFTGGQWQAMNNTLHDVNRIIQSRQEGATGRSSGDEFFGNKNIWFKPFGSWARQDSRNGISGYSADTYGMVFGADTEISNSNRVGAAFAYAYSNVDGNSSVTPQSANVKSYLFNLYGSHSLDDTTDLNFQAGIGKNDTNGHRTISFGALNEVASSSHDGWNAHIGGGIAHTMNLSDATSFTPSLRADYTVIHSSGYSETGADILNLTVNSQSAHELVLGVDGKVIHALTDKIKFTANLGGGYDVINDQASITAAFAGAPTAAFVTNGLNPSPWMTRGGLGLVSKPNDTVEITARYDFDVRDGFNNQTASVKVRWAF